MTKERKCRGTSKQTGLPCGLPPVPGALVCRFHGGRAPQTMAKAAQNLAEQAARDAADKLGVLIDITPEQALLDEVKRSAGLVCFYQARVVELEADDRGSLVWGITKEKDGGDDEGTTLEAAPNVWLKLFNDERRHLVAVAAAAIRAGIEERRVKLAEQEGALVAAVIRRILDQLGLTPEQAALVPVVVPKELRALTA